MPSNILEMSGRTMQNEMRAVIEAGLEILLFSLQWQACAQVTRSRLKPPGSSSKRLVIFVSG